MMKTSYRKRVRRVIAGKVEYLLRSDLPQPLGGEGCTNGDRERVAKEEVEAVIALVRAHADKE